MYILLLWVSILCCQIIFFPFFFPHYVAYGLLVPQPGIKPEGPAVEAQSLTQSLNHWTTREVPRLQEVPRFFFFFWPHGTICGILVPRPEIKPGPLAVREQSPSHWTAREFPKPPYQSRALPPLAVPKKPRQLSLSITGEWQACKCTHGNIRKKDLEAQSGPSHSRVALAKSFNPSEFGSLICQVVQG